MLFLATETRENIESGLRFVKDALSDVPTHKLFFFVDKDFDYIEVLRNIFPNCTIYLCSVHVYRYIREKVLPSSKLPDGSEVDKLEILNKFKEI